MIVTHAFSVLPFTLPPRFCRRLNPPQRPRFLSCDGTAPLAACLAGVRPFHLIFALAFACAACERPVSRTDQALSANGRLVALSGGAGGAVHACFSCHGLDGGGDGVAAPKLAGLQVGYLQKQMEDYATGLRPDAVMTPVAKALDHRARNAVAAYYAGLPTPVGQNAPEEVRTTPELWSRGDPARGLMACAACHGAEGQGVSDGSPALAGQPAAYTRDQLARWRRGERRNDPRAVMTNIARELRPAETAALAVWLERRSASQAPANDAPSVLDAEAAAARSAASREGRRLDR